MNLRYFTLFLLVLIATVTLTSQGMTWGELTDIASNQSPFLQEKDLQILSQKHFKKQVLEEFLPSVSALASQGETSRDPEIPGEVEELSEIGVGATWLLFNGFSSTSRWKKEQFGIELKQAEKEQQARDLWYDLRRLFFDVLISKEELVLANKIYNRQVKNSKFIRLKYKSGAEALWSYNKALAEKQRAELNVQSVESRIQRRLIEIKRFAGLKSETPVSIKEPLEPYFKIAISSNTEYESHPDIRQIETLISRAQQDIKIARAEYFPTVSAGTSWKRQTIDGSDVDVTEIGISAKLPLFEGFSTFQKVQQARVEKSRFEKLKLITLKRVDSAVQRASLDLKIKASQIPIVKAELKAARKRVQTINTQYKIGLKKFLDWEQAQVNLIEKEQEEIQVKRETLLALAQLERAKGIRIRTKRQ